MRLRGARIHGPCPLHLCWVRQSCGEKAGASGLPTTWTQACACSLVTPKVSLLSSSWVPFLSTLSLGNFLTQDLLQSRVMSQDNWGAPLQGENPQ